MSDEITKTVPEQVSDSLSSALFKANKAKGVLILLATDDDSIWTFSAGDLVVKLGLVQMAQIKGIDLVQESETEDEDE